MVFERTADVREVPELATRFMKQPDQPTRSGLVDRYERRTGIAFEHERFYRALAVYKFAAPGEMFYRRYLEDYSDDSLYPKMETHVPALGAQAKRIIDGDEPL